MTVLENKIKMFIKCNDRACAPQHSERARWWFRFWLTDPPALNARARYPNSRSNPGGRRAVGNRFRISGCFEKKKKIRKTCFHRPDSRGTRHFPLPPPPVCVCAR